MLVLFIVILYLILLLGLGYLSGKRLLGTSRDFFVANHSIGPFLLLMSLFGTTMTSFALVGSTGKAFERGIGVYGLMASISALVHCAIFFFIGIRLWTIGKKNGYLTQVQFFRARFNSNAIGYVLFPLLVLLVIPYLLIGIMGAGQTMLPVTAGAFPNWFPTSTQWSGAVPSWLTGLVICAVVLAYVFMGGSRATAWANAFQTLVFMLMGLLAFVFISKNLGGLQKATLMSAQFDDRGRLIQTHRFDKATRSILPHHPPKIIGQYSGNPSEVSGKRPLLSRTKISVTLFKQNPQTHKTHNPNESNPNDSNDPFSNDSDLNNFDSNDSNPNDLVSNDLDSNDSDSNDSNELNDSVSNDSVSNESNPNESNDPVSNDSVLNDSVSNESDSREGGFQVERFSREFGFGKWLFFTYLFIPLSAGMFPHLFQHWLSARSARAFRLTMIAHPICILIVWLPCVLIGTWATGILEPLETNKVASVLGTMLGLLVGSPILSGLLTAGILAAIMSSLDSQFLCLGTLFTNDIVLHAFGKNRFSERQIIFMARCFVVVIVVISYLLSLVAPKNIFDLAVWCFTGFASLVPLLIASLYWQRTTLIGAYASIGIAVITWLKFFVDSGFGGEYAIGPGILPAAICVLSSSLTLVIVSLFTKPPDAQTLSRFFSK